jgi:hypothetical protein
MTPCISKILLVSPVGGPRSLGEIRGAAAVGKASAAARNFLRVPSAPRVPMAMTLTQAPRTGALVPMGHGRWCGASFFKEILKALLHSAGAGYGHRSPNPNGASARGGLEKKRACPLPVAKPGVCHNLPRGMAGGFAAI